MRIIHWASGLRNTGKLPRSLRPSMTSSLATTVPRPGAQLTVASARYASRWLSITVRFSTADSSGHGRS